MIRCVCPVASRPEHSGIIGEVGQFLHITVDVAAVLIVRERYRIRDPEKSVLKCFPVQIPVQEDIFGIRRDDLDQRDQTGRAVFRQSVVEFRGVGKLIDAVGCRKEQTPQMFLADVQRVNVEFLFPVIGAETEEVALVRKDPQDLVLFEESLKRSLFHVFGKPRFHGQRKMSVRTEIVGEHRVPDDLNAVPVRQREVESAQIGKRIGARIVPDVKILSRPVAEIADIENGDFVAPDRDARVPAERKLPVPVVGRPAQTPWKKNQQQQQAHQRQSGTASAPENDRQNHGGGKEQGEELAGTLRQVAGSVYQNTRTPETEQEIDRVKGCGGCFAEPAVPFEKTVDPEKKYGGNCHGRGRPYFFRSSK